jgi:hypothetical protein
MVLRTSGRVAGWRSPVRPQPTRGTGFGLLGLGGLLIMLEWFAELTGRALLPDGPNPGYTVLGIVVVVMGGVVVARTPHR